MDKISNSHLVFIKKNIWKKNYGNLLTIAKKTKYAFFFTNELTYASSVYHF